MPVAPKTQTKKESTTTTNDPADEFVNSATEINTIINQVNRLNDEMMSTFDTLHDSIKKHFVQFQTKFTDLETQLQAALAENRDHKDAADTFNRVSMLKKQDIQIRQDQIKIAELESRIKFLEKDIENRETEKYNNVRSFIQLKKEMDDLNKNKFLEKENSRLSSQPADQAEPVSKPASTATKSAQVATKPAASVKQVEETETELCNARIGKKKFKISNQVAEFMDDYPEGVFITDTGCVIGQVCNEPIPNGQVFCSKHSNGKFEDIRKPPADMAQPASKSNPTPTPTPIPKPKVAAEPEEDEPISTHAKVLEPEEEVDEEPKEEPVKVEPVKKQSAPAPAKVSTTPAKPAPAKVPAPEPVEDEVEEEPVEEEHAPKAAVASPPVVGKGLNPLINTSAKAPVKIPNLDTDNNIDIHTFADNTSYYINTETGDLFEMTENDDIGVFVGKLKK
jgi:hypothetical protein